MPVYIWCVLLVCMHGCKYICKHLCDRYVWVQSIYVCVCVCVCVYTYICIHTYIFIHVFDLCVHSDYSGVRVFMYLCIYVCMS